MGVGCVRVTMSLWTTYIYYWKWILYETTDIKDSRIKVDLISYPLLYETSTFMSCIFFSFFILGFGPRTDTKDKHV